MKPIIALFAFALACEAHYPPAGVPAHLYEEVVAAPIPPVQYTIPSIAAPVQNLVEVRSDAVTVENPLFNGIYNPYISTIPGVLPSTSYLPINQKIVGSLFNSNLGYRYSTLSGHPAPIFLESPGLINGIPLNGLPAISTLPAAPEVLSYSSPFSSVHLANFGSEVVVQNEPSVVEIKQEEIQPVEVVVPEVPALTHTFEILPQKPAVFRYDYAIPEVVQEVKPIVPHTVYGVPTL